MVDAIQTTPVLCRTIGGFVKPLCHVLMPAKDGINWETMFRQLRTAFPTLNPTTVNCDYEVRLLSCRGLCLPPHSLPLFLQIAIHQGANRVFGRHIRVHGCEFHLVRSMKSCLAENDLTLVYNTDAAFNTRCKMVVACSYIPPTRFDRTFLDVNQYLLSVDPRLKPVIDWFDKHYAGTLAIY